MDRHIVTDTAINPHTAVIDGMVVSSPPGALVYSITYQLLHVQAPHGMHHPPNTMKAERCAGGWCRCKVVCNGVMQILLSCVSHVNIHSAQHNCYSHAYIYTRIYIHAFIYV